MRLWPRNHQLCARRSSHTRGETTTNPNLKHNLQKPKSQNSNYQPLVIYATTPYQTAQYHLIVKDLFTSDLLDHPLFEAGKVDCTRGEALVRDF